VKKKNTPLGVGVGLYDLDGNLILTFKKQRRVS